MALFPHKRRAVNILGAICSFSWVLLEGQKSFPWKMTCFAFEDDSRAVPFWAASELSLVVVFIHFALCSDAVR